MMIMMMMMMMMMMMIMMMMMMIHSLYARDYSSASLLRIILRGGRIEVEIRDENACILLLSISLIQFLSRASIQKVFRQIILITTN